ncbi:MAG: AmpG family muropeptide MFS transporter [Burkholderiales bacterium]|nr:AmpG family muropeptide MFS transporter [Burkholderiales bacterium]
MPNTERLDTALFNRRTLMCVFTGFSSGLPLYLLINLFPAWLKTEHVDIKQIGLLGLTQLPYTWKFLWAPFLDRYGIGGKRLGRRRGWMALTQLLLLASIAILGCFSPATDLPTIAALATIVALFSATQDVALDAYRRELLPDAELGLGNAVHVNAYRIASLVPGSLALILADHLPWSSVFGITALFMLPGFFATLLAPTEERQAEVPATLQAAVVEPFKEFIQRLGPWVAVETLLFLFLYKLGDAMATSLATPFYLDLGFSKTEIGLVAKHAALWPSVAGGLLGGLWMVRLGVNRALWLFGLVQLFSILGFAWLAGVGHHTFALAMVIGVEAIGVGLGATALVAFIARTTNPRYTATQFALFTTLATLARAVLSSSAGYLVKAMGWQHYFWFCFALAIPGMLLLFRVAPWGAQTDDNARADAK